MKSIQVFNRYVAPLAIVLIAAVVLSGCHRWHHPRGHHGHHGHGGAKYGGYGGYGGHGGHGGHHGRVERGH